MSDNRRRRSSFFQKPVEESSEKQLELFQNMDWVVEEKKKIASESMLFGNLGRKILNEYTERLKNLKQKYPKLVSNKQEEQIHLKEKLHNNKIEIDWETASEGLTELEKDFADSRPDYKCLVEKVYSLTLHTALIRRANYEQQEIFNAYNRQANKEIQKMQEFFIDKIIEDSGVGLSFYSNINSSNIESSDDE